MAKGKSRPKMDDYVPELWRTLRILFETGKYKNLTALYKEQSPLHPPEEFPPLQLIQQIADVQGWDKHDMDEVVTEIQRRNAAEVLAECGMNQVERYKRLAKSIQAADDVISIVQRLQNKLSDLQPDQIPNDDLLQKIKSMSETVFKGMAVSVKAQDIAIRLTGEYSPEKTQEIKHGGRYGDKQKSVEEMDREELQAEYKRMRAAGIKDPTEEETPPVSPDVS